MAQKTGRVTIKVGGVPFVSKPGATLQLGGIMREADISDQGRSFYTEQWQAAECSFTLIHTKDTDLEAIRAMKDAPLEFACDTGRSYTVPNAFYKSDEGLSAGEVNLTFGGDPGVQH